MDTKIIAFPAPHVTAPKPARGQRKNTRIISLERWKSNPRPHRTAHGVFFVTSVLTSQGDFA